MNIFFFMFLSVLLFVCYFAYSSLGKHPLLTTGTAIVLAIIGNAFGTNLSQFGDFFKEPQAAFVGQSIVIITSIITGSLVSCAFSEIREEKRKKQKMVQPAGCTPPQNPGG